MGCEKWWRTAGLGDRVQFLGERPIDEVPGWYRRIIIYAFTSRNEGFGLTLLEAMASGNALVAARAGVAEMVVVDGETGVLVPPGDVDALVRRSNPSCATPRGPPRWDAAPRARAMAEFSLETEAERIVASLGQRTVNQRMRVNQNHQSLITDCRYWLLEARHSSTNAARLPPGNRISSNSGSAGGGEVACPGRRSESCAR